MFPEGFSMLWALSLAPIDRARCLELLSRREVAAAGGPEAREETGDVVESDARVLRALRDTEQMEVVEDGEGVVEEEEAWTLKPFKPF